MASDNFEKRYLREKAARKSAERHLEEKSLELYARNQELEGLKASLERLVEARTREAVEATQDAIRANRAKSQFLANMSHEIRTPLTAIIGYADLIRREKPDIEITESHLSTIIDNGRHLTELLGEILDLSKIETQNLKLEQRRFNLPDMLTELKELYSVSALSKSLNLSFDITNGIPKWLNSDPTRLKQVLSNLLSNAIKFTAKGEIRLVVFVDLQTALITFTVSDTGEGIQQEQQKHIFDSFKQADASITRKYGGTGLGLSIAKSLVKLMGGDLTVKSEPNIGSEFSASITARELEGMAYSLPDVRPKKQINSLDIPKLCGEVLLVEDTFINQQLIKHTIEITGASVTIANNGQEAIEHAISQDFDLILMDIQMPVLDGKKALQGLVQLGINRPVYALTANVMQSDIAEYQTLGFNGTLAKPLDLERLYAVLVKHLPHGEKGKLQSKKTINQQIASETDKLRSLFFNALEQQHSELLAYIKQNDYVEIGKILHVIKGSAGSFGFEDLSLTAGDALTMIRQEQTTHLVKPINDVMLKIEKIINKEKCCDQ